MSTTKYSKKSPRPPQDYSEAFKRQVVSEFERGLYTKAELQRRYGIFGNSCIPRWCKKYGKLPYNTPGTNGRPMKDPQKQKIKELELALKKKEDELEIYKRFISIAERELNISIVKKSGTRQSKK